uniref:Uncharacterized protein n=1 Tax=Ananas comosus var. bracteatus TaxID=296719 RepID=A0A6V7PVL4_ANACO|nr:unnamed protein product [Ananas comosus var. bracteatus]
MLAVPVQGFSVPVQATRTDLAALGLALVPVQEPVYRYKGVVLVENPVGDSVADVAPRAVRARLLPELCEEAGRGCVFAVLDIAPRIVAVENLPSTVSISARSPRRSVGSRRNLVHWILDCERIPRSPHLQFLDEVSLVETCWSLIELDRDTLHTRLGSAHECHSGVRLVLLRCPDWIGSDLTFPTVEPQVSAAAPSADLDRGKGVAS